MGILVANTASIVIPAGDQANFVASGSIATATESGIFNIYGAFNYTLTGTWAGSVSLERSFDGGSTWSVANIGMTATLATLTANASLTMAEVERGVMYRVNVTALSANGPIGWRVSTSGRGALTFGVSGVG